MSIEHTFDLGGSTNASMDIMLLKSDRRILPATDDRLSEVPGQIGAHDSGADLGALEFDLRCKFIGGLTETALQTDARNLTDHLTDDNGEPREMELSFQDETDKTWTVRYSGDGLDVGRGVGKGRGEFNLPLIAADPRAYGTTATLTQTATATPHTIDVVNDGNVKTPLEITLTNNGTNAVSGITIEVSE